MCACPVCLEVADGAEGWLVVTSRGLALSGPDCRARLAHINWLEIERVAVRRQRGEKGRRVGTELVVHRIDQSEPTRAFLPKADHHLVEVLTERLWASVVMTEHVKVPGGQIRGALRRAHDDELEIQIIVPPELDAEAPEVKQAVAELGQRLGERVGLTPQTW